MQQTLTQIQEEFEKEFPESCLKNEEDYKDLKSWWLEKIRQAIVERDEEIKKWAKTEIEYVDEQLKTETEEDLIEYLTGKKNLAKDLIIHLTQE